MFFALRSILGVVAKNAATAENACGESRAEIEKIQSSPVSVKQQLFGAIRGISDPLAKRVGGENANTLDH